MVPPRLIPVIPNVERHPYLSDVMMTSIKLSSKLRTVVLLAETSLLFWFSGDVRHERSLALLPGFFGLSKFVRSDRYKM